MKDNLDFHIIVRILVHMSEVIKLIKDNLVDYFGGNKVLAVFVSEGCSACEKFKPHLNKLPEEYKVVIVDSLKHMASVRYVPGGIKFYPTIVLFENGYLKEELTMNQIITKTQQ